MTRGRITRTVAALAAAALTLGACGGDDGPSALSEDEFLDELADVCATARRRFERIEEPQDHAAIEAGSEEAADILQDALDDLAAIVAPEQYARDFAEFRSVVTQELEQYEALGAAASDEDDAEIQSVVEEITAIEQDRNSLAEELDSEDCISDEAPEPSGPGEPTDSTDPTDPSTPATNATDPTVTPTTNAPITLPPITTAPPVDTTPVDTEPVGDGTIEIDSITSVFTDPAGFTMVDTSEEIVGNVVTALQLDPELGAIVDVVGAGDLVNPATDIVDARLIIAYTADEQEMPAAWDELWCQGAGEQATTAAGYVGRRCVIDDGEGGMQYFFVLHAGNGGIAVLAVDEQVDVAGILDAFLAANPNA